MENIITTPTAIAKPVGMEIIMVETALQMKAAVEKAVTSGHALIMASAVADYQVRDVSQKKIKKEQGNLVRYAALAISTIAFLLSLVIYFQFDSANSDFQFINKIEKFFSF